MQDSPLDLSAYVLLASQLMNLPIPSDSLPKVVDNLERIQQIASLVTQFELADEIESAPVFEP